jgi:hypothetical protein
MVAIMRHRRQRSLRLLAVLVTLALSGFAREASAHDRERRGIMGRVHLGLGMLYLCMPTETSPAVVSGVGTTGDLTLGYWVETQLAFHGTIAVGTAFDTSLRQGPSDGFVSNVSVVTSSLAVGTTFVFGPHDVFVSGSVGVGLIALDVSFRGARARDYLSVGVVTHGAVGKHFSLTNDLGLGAALHWSIQTDPRDWQDVWEFTSTEDVGATMVYVGGALSLAWH